MRIAFYADRTLGRERDQPRLHLGVAVSAKQHALTCLLTQPADGHGSAPRVDFHPLQCWVKVIAPE